MKSIALLSLFVLFVSLCESAEWKVTTTRVNNGKPVIKKGSSGVGNSNFDWNYNAAWMRSPRSPLEGGLLVRCQNKTKDLYTPGPSVLVYAKLRGSLRNLANIQFEYIQDSDIKIRPNGPSSVFGTEDPRSDYNPKDDSHYVLFSEVAVEPNGHPVSNLALAVVKNKDISQSSSWKRYGPIFDTKNVTWSKSGSLLLRQNGPSYLYWGDESLFVATTDDGIHYKNPNYPSKPFIHTRKDKFDSVLCEGGPNPFKLSDGNYLMLYNSARNGYKSKKPGWDLQYNIGYVILDGKDLTKILYRSEQPIFSPQLDWEIADGTGLTPNVVFVEGWTQLPSPDTFLFFYGAADSYVGAATLKVSIRK